MDFSKKLTDVSILFICMAACTSRSSNVSNILKTANSVGTDASKLTSNMKFTSCGDKYNGTTSVTISQNIYGMKDFSATTVAFDQLHLYTFHRISTKLKKSKQMLKDNVTESSFYQMS